MTAVRILFPTPRRRRLAVIAHLDDIVVMKDTIKEIITAALQRYEVAPFMKIIDLGEKVVVVFYVSE